MTHPNFNGDFKRAKAYWKKCLDNLDKRLLDMFDVNPKARELLERRAELEANIKVCERELQKQKHPEWLEVL